jgi:hypothetical protein
MAPITTARLATCVVAATFVSAAAATLPTEALADDGSVSVPVAPVTAPSLDTGAVLAGEASAAVEGAMAAVLGETAQAAAQPTEEAAPADATPPAAPSAATPVETVRALETAPVQAPSEPDTTPVSSDIATGIATTAAPAATSPAGAVQASPTNVNVSVRIGSPGDNGPVTQLNVVAAVGTAPSATGSGTSATPATTTAAPSTTSGGAHASTPAPQPAAASSSSAQDDPDTWTWQWNCLSKPDLSVIPVAGSTTGSVPRNWTWIWNCGENPAQYQDATAAQYQPSNTNISIRISSPGNDGPVSQANVAIAAHVGLPVVATPAGPAVVVPVPVPVADVVSQAVIPGMTSLPALVAPPEPVWLGGDVSVRSIVETVHDVVDLPYLLPPLAGAGTFRLVERQRRLPALGGRAVPVVGRLAPLGALDLGTLTVADAEASSADGRSAAAGVSPSRAAKNKKQIRWRAPLPQPMPVPVPSGASFAPATGGSSSGGGIPVFLALPFLAAMVDLARRVTLDRVALPSGHRSRVPEDPG